MEQYKDQHKLTFILRSLVVLLLLNACGENQSGTNTSPSAKPSTISVRDALSGNSLSSETTVDKKAGFEQAKNKRAFNFPEDHGAHPRFRNEWWYFTGNLSNEQGRRFGYQVTFFRVGLNPPPPLPQNQKQHQQPPSAWHTQNIWMAHAAISDIEPQQHLSRERFSRGNPGLAGANFQPFRVWLDNWRVVSDKAPDSAGFPWQLQVADDDFSLQLNLSPEKPIVLQGDQGLSQKSNTPGNASYYYSMPRLATNGHVTIHGQRFAVEGLSWMDREWSTSALDKDQTGWDWFSLQFESGEDLMYYQLLDQEGRPHSASQGKWIGNQTGNQTGNQSETKTISSSDISLTPLIWWESKHGTKWPVSWQMDYLTTRQSWIINALIENQLMDLSVVYWEGAVEVIDRVTGNHVGYGYLEMTRSKND